MSGVRTMEEAELSADDLDAVTGGFPGVSDAQACAIGATIASKLFDPTYAEAGCAWGVLVNRATGR